MISRDAWSKEALRQFPKKRIQVQSYSIEAYGRLYGRLVFVTIDSDSDMNF